MIDHINSPANPARGWKNKNKYANKTRRNNVRPRRNSVETAQAHTDTKKLLNHRGPTQQKHLPVTMSSASRPGLKSTVSLNLFLLSKYCLINVSLMDYPLSSSEVVVKKNRAWTESSFVRFFLYLLSLYSMHYRLWLRSPYWIRLGRWSCLPT